jgi:hypothetical protein
MYFCSRIIVIYQTMWNVILKTRAKEARILSCNIGSCSSILNPLNAELNSICHLLALLGAHHILHISRIRVNTNQGDVSYLILRLSTTVISIRWDGTTTYCELESSQEEVFTASIHNVMAEKWIRRMSS